jgi:hypothetical protein
MRRNDSFFYQSYNSEIFYICKNAFRDSSSSDSHHSFFANGAETSDEQLASNLKPIP